MGHEMEWETQQKIKTNVPKYMKTDKYICKHKQMNTMMISVWPDDDLNDFVGKLEIKTLAFFSVKHLPILPNDGIIEIQDLKLNFDLKQKKSRKKCDIFIRAK